MLDSKAGAGGTRWNRGIAEGWVAFAWSTGESAALVAVVVVDFFGSVYVVVGRLLEA